MLGLTVDAYSIPPRPFRLIEGTIRVDDEICRQLRYLGKCAEAEARSNILGTAREFDIFQCDPASFRDR